MKSQSKHTALLALAQNTGGELQSFIARLSKEEREATGSLERWSAKDLLAHIAEWRERIAKTLTSTDPNTPPPFEDIHYTNAELFAAFQDLPWETVEAKEAAAYARIIQLIQGMSEAELVDTQRFAWQNGRPLWRTLAINSGMHPLLHVSDYYLQHDQPDEVVRLQEALQPWMAAIDPDPAWQGLTVYNLACYYAQAGRKEPALKRLTEAIQLHPKAAEWARTDTDLVSLVKEPEFHELVHD